MVVLSKDTTACRSLTSLQLVPPPPPPPSKADVLSHEEDADIENWDPFPFPSPYAPNHGQPRREAREDDDGHVNPRRSSTEDIDRCSRDVGVKEETILKVKSTKVDNNNNRTSKPTPPRNISYPRQVEAEAAYVEKYFNSTNTRKTRNRSRSSNRQQTLTTNPEKGGKESLIKITPTGGITGNKEKISTPPKRRSMSRTSNDIPVLTQDRVDLHFKQSRNQSDNCTNRAVNTESCQEVEYNYNKSSAIMCGGSTPTKLDKHVSTSKISTSSPPPSQPQPKSSSTSKRKSDKTSKIFMIDNTKVYSRTLVPPTIYYNPVTGLWIVTINNSNEKGSKSFMSKTLQKMKSSSTNNDSTLESNVISVETFSYQTEKEARTSAYAHAPPIMKKNNNVCMQCSSGFTFFKRPHHCANCGIIICNKYKCCTYWSNDMLPKTYHENGKKNKMMKSSTVRVCTSCNILSKRFQHALEMGRYDTAMELFLTGNINLRVPYTFNNKSGGSYPVHFAIEGQSEKLVRWLVDIQHCPLFVSSTESGKGGEIDNRSGSDGVASSVMNAGARLIQHLSPSTTTDSKRYQSERYIPTLRTSKGRSIIDVALKTRHVGILRYLINEKKVSVYEVEELELALGALEALVKGYPDVHESCNPDMRIDDTKGQRNNNTGDTVGDGIERKSTCSTEHIVSKNSSSSFKKKTNTTTTTTPRMYSIVQPAKVEEKIILPRDVHGIKGTSGLYHDNIDCSSYDDIGVNSNDEEDETTLVESVIIGSVVSTIVTPNECIRCQKCPPNCVATPCGHQSCCINCSNQVLKCPVCNVECHFIS